MTSKALNRVFRSNNFLSLTGSAAASGLGFLSFAILIRLLDKSSFGNWMMFVTSCTLTELLRTGMLQTGLIRFCAGKGDSERKIILGSGWIFSIAVTVFLALFTFSLDLFFHNGLVYPGLQLFFRYYWLLTIVSLPFNYSTWYMQTIMDFRRLLVVRLIVLSGFITLLVISFFYKADLQTIVFYYILSQGTCSVITMILGWTKLHFIAHATRSKIAELFHFGKYSMGTMMGANLLRNSDTLIIGAMMNAEAVAVYSVPLKLFEIIEIPLRSFVATALPSMSAMHNNGNKTVMKAFFERTTGAFTFFLVPVTILCWICSDLLVTLLGGAEYSEAVFLFRIFSLLALFMPLDRYTGIALDVLNKPSLNFLKVIIMLMVNIAGDIIVINYTGQLWAVAAVSICTFLTGMMLGVILLKQYLDVSVKNLMIEGVVGARASLVKISHIFKPAAN
jgi:O-antigen/teichoic acid export membrane protein